MRKMPDFPSLLLRMRTIVNIVMGSTITGLNGLMTNKKEKTSCEMYGISRIDNPKHHTHTWRVSLRRQGKMHVKNFPDKKHKGRDNALRMAKQHRDWVVKTYQPTTRKQFCSATRRNNRSGITGVYTYAKPYTLSNGTIKECWYWEANWPDKNHQSVSVRFSVKEYGEDIARQMAIRARQRGLESVSGIFWASARGEAEVEVKRNTDVGKIGSVAG